MGFIDGAQLERLATAYPNDYGQYLKGVLNDPYEPGL